MVRRSLVHGNPVTGPMGMEGRSVYTLTGNEVTIGVSWDGTRDPVSDQKSGGPNHYLRRYAASDFRSVRESWTGVVVTLGVTDKV